MFVLKSTHHKVLQTVDDLAREVSSLRQQGREQAAEHSKERTKLLNEKESLERRLQQANQGIASTQSLYEDLMTRHMSAGSQLAQRLRESKGPLTKELRNTLDAHLCEPLHALTKA